MSATIDITESAVLAVLRSFLLSVLPGGTVSPPTIEVVRGQANRVPEPKSDNYVVMTPVMRTQLETASNTYADVQDPVGNPSGTNAATTSVELTVQLDCHGPGSGENAQIITTLFRDEVACEFFSTTGAGIAAPLYSSDPRQIPFINGESQFEERWSVDAAIQINAAVTVPQDFASTIGPVRSINVQASYIGVS